MANELVFELGWSQAWQGLVACAVICVTCRFLAKSSPRWCFLLWLAVLLKLVIPPTLFSPTGIFSWMRIGIDAMLVPAHEPVVPGAAIPFKSIVASLNAISPWTLASIWFLGALTYGVCIFARCRRFSRLLLNSAERKDPNLQALTNSIADELEVPKKIRVTVTREPIGPAVVGIRRPTIVLPKAIVADKAPSELTPIIAHEILHVKRWDTLLTLFAVAANVIWWFNPLVRFAASRVSQYSEHSCDLEVINFLQFDRASYARCLVNVLETKQKIRPVLGFPGVRASQLTAGRIRTIMKKPFPVRTLASQFLAAAFLTVLVLIIVPGKAPTLPAVDAPPRPDIACIEAMARE